MVSGLCWDLLVRCRVEYVRLVLLVWAGVFMFALWFGFSLVVVWALLLGFVGFAFLLCWILLLGCWFDW